MTSAQTNPTRADCLFIAELAGDAERYEDVIMQIKIIINHFHAQLTADERNLLSVAYKNITNRLRSSWRIVDTLEKMQASRSSPTSRQLFLLRHQRDRIESELTGVCKDIVLILDTQLLPAAQRGEETVFYSKMKGDYYRYLAEFARQDEKDKFAELSLTAYKLAYQHSMSTLAAVHPVRLGVALNFSVFYHDVRKSPERACHLAKSAFDDAISSLDTSGESQNLQDSLMILQLLRDDLTLWAEEMQNSER